MSIPWPRLLAVSLLALALAGCGDGGGTPDPSPGPGAAATSTPAADDAPSPAPTEALDSFTYRYEIELTPEGEAGGDTPPMRLRVTGSFQGPDRTHLEARGRLGDAEYAEEIIAVGDRAWVREGPTWREAERADPDVQSTLALSPGDAGFWEGLNLGEALAPLDGKLEHVNGVPARRVSLKPEEIALYRQLAAGDLLEGLEQVTLEAWLAEDGGWPLRLSIEGTAAGDVFGVGEDPTAPLRFRVELNLTDVNSEEVRVEPPA